MNRIRELEKSLKSAESAAKSNRATILELRQRLHNQESHINETNGKKESELKQAGEHIKHLKEKLSEASSKLKTGLKMLLRLYRELFEKRLSRRRRRQEAN